MQLSRLFGIAISLLSLLAGMLPAAASANSATAIKVCAAKNELPYSNLKKEGFENRIAELIAGALNRRLEYVWWEDPRYYIRDYLDKGLCELVIGLDTGDPRVLTTEAYYRSAYVFVTRKSEGLDIGDWGDPRVRQLERIAFVPNTPVEVMVRTIGRYSEMFNYMHSLVNFKSPRNQYVRYDPARLVNEVASGNAELAALWGPSAARYVLGSGTALNMTVIPDNNTRADGQPVPHHYSTSLGVRKDDRQLMTDLNKALTALKPKIQAILRQEGVPLVADGAARLVSKN
ncbi:MAG: methanol oxidation system protein MoxJ [Methylococcaceae bacterium]|nr:methanol oxidation system protein MoxJ [Methylococcaceae bacterium]